MKQCIVVRKDLKMPLGKLAAQVAHASVETVLNSDKKTIDKWKEDGMKKVVLKVENKRQLFNLKKKADKLGLVTAVIKDAGRTFFKRSTITCLGIGPDKEEDIDKITEDLKMF